LAPLSNVNSFPQPLSPEEEQHYLDLLKKGDEEARNILIERNLRLVAHIVKKYSSTINDSDDLISIGTIGLIKAISTFNHEKGTRLATYAARCIENEILMHIRSNKKTQSEVSLQDPIGVDRDGNEIALIDVIGNESESVVEEVELKMQVKRLYNKMKDVLKAREKMVLELRYGLFKRHRQDPAGNSQNVGYFKILCFKNRKKSNKKNWEKSSNQKASIII